MYAQFVAAEPSGRTTRRRSTMWPGVCPRVRQGTSMNTAPVATSAPMSPS